eukprot:3342793-Alexandrium_andersonii.AAC.1
MPGVVASYHDQHNEEYPPHACYPETAPPPGERAAARVQSYDVLAAATKHCVRGGMDPAQTVPAAEHFRARDDIERQAVRDTVMRLPDERSRQ